MSDISQRGVLLSRSPPDESGRRSCAGLAIARLSIGGRSAASELLRKRQGGCSYGGRAPATPKSLHLPAAACSTRPSVAKGTATLLWFVARHRPHRAPDLDRWYGRGRARPARQRTRPDDPAGREPHSRTRVGTSRRPGHRCDLDAMAIPREGRGLAPQQPPAARAPQAAGYCRSTRSTRSRQCAAPVGSGGAVCDPCGDPRHPSGDRSELERDGRRGHARDVAP